MRRREFLAVMAGAAALWPPMAFGQLFEPLRNVGVLMGLAENDPEIPPRVAALRRSLQELGWIEGHNIRVHYRSAIDADRMQLFAKELVALQPHVIVAANSFVVNALLRETNTIPIVFVSSADPVGRPGGNATWPINNLSSIGGKRLELLMQIAPGTTNFGVMCDPETAPGGGSYFLPQLQAVAASLGATSNSMPVRIPSEIESSGLVVMPDHFPATHRVPIVLLAAHHRVPTIYPSRYFATASGLMSYGADLNDPYRRVSSNVDRILKGANPADVPVPSPDRIELVINLNVTKVLGPTVPRILLARTDEIIE